LYEPRHAISPPPLNALEIPCTTSLRAIDAGRRGNPRCSCTSPGTPRHLIHSKHSKCPVQPRCEPSTEGRGAATSVLLCQPGLVRYPLAHGLHRQAVPEVLTAETEV